MLISDRRENESILTFNKQWNTYMWLTEEQFNNQIHKWLIQNIPYTLTSKTTMLELCDDFYCG